MPPRICTICGLEKDIKHFHKKHYQCKLCYRIRDRNAKRKRTEELNKEKEIEKTLSDYIEIDILI